MDHDATLHRFQEPAVRHGRMEGNEIMSVLDRRSAVKLMSATALALPAILKTTRVRAAEFTLKYANNVPPIHPMTVRMTEAAEAIRQETGGKVDLQVFPNSQMGGDTDVLSQLRSGAIDFFTLSPIILSTLVPKASISGVGFAWSSYDKVWAAMDGSLGAFIRAQIEASGLYAFEREFDNGFRQVTTSTKPIRTPDDFRGLKIRVPRSPLWTSMFKAFGAAPSSINFVELYFALQTHVVDAQENPINVLESTKLFEVQKYVSLTNHMWDGFWFLASRRGWRSLPKDVQAVLERHVNAAALKERADIAELNAKSQDRLTSLGLVFNTVDTGAFQERLRSAGFYQEWRGRYGEDAWKALEANAGAVS